jgi:DNA-binding transcriptional ArsR family regulator
MDNPIKQELQTLADIDRFIHEPSRLVILALLSAVESADFIYVMNQTGLTRGNLSVHMSKLKDAGYITVEKEFIDNIPRTLLGITDEGRKVFHDYRARMIKALDNLGE